MTDNKLTNMDPETGFRYGVIHHGVVNQTWYEASEPNYGSPTCPDCGKVVRPAWELDEVQDAALIAEFALIPAADSEDFPCGECKRWYGTDEVFPEQPLAFILDDDEYQAEQGGDDTDIFVTKSPYYTYAKFCSPCAPGAGDLSSCFRIPENYRHTYQALQDLGLDDVISQAVEDLASRDGYVQAYCFGHDWFENETAPYMVFDVETRDFVPPVRGGNR
jgi:hypothetical protein